jgi:hypothetical protein
MAKVTTSGGLSVIANFSNSLGHGLTSLAMD